MQTAQRERYENFDGMRAYACIGIVLMHVLSNGYLSLTASFFKRLILSFTDFTYLFMLFSSFSLCCGYYEKIKNRSVSVDSFYKRRYQRIWPFFAFLCTVEMLLSHDLNSVYEWFADITLIFGLIPSNGIGVVGVGWFLGTIFVFYMLFPFFVFLLDSKKRAWFTFVICLILHILCVVRFEGAAGRSNIVYSSIFFVSGGIVYLYREKLKGVAIIKWIASIILGISLVCYYAVNDSALMLLVIFTSLTIIGITSGGGIAKAVFQNKFATFIGGISMEIYLCHMFVYRVYEKLRLTSLTRYTTMNYIIVSVFTLIGAIAFALVWKYMYCQISKCCKKRVVNK